jgi:hypothetical protein
MQFKLEDENKEIEKLKTEIKMYKAIEDVIFTDEMLKEVKEFIEKEN